MSFSHRMADAPIRQQLYTYAVETGTTWMIPANVHYFRNSSAPINTEFDDPWLPMGNLLEYVIRPGSAYPPGADSTLTVYDLDADSPWFVQPAPPVVSTATDSGKPISVEPSGICQRIWLQNDELLWHGCDENPYLSRIVEGGLAETRMLVRSVDPFFTLSGNRELVIVQPAGGVGNWWMYDFAGQRPVELQGADGMSCCWESLLQ